MDKAGVLKLRSESKLHSTVEQRLAELFDKASPGTFTVKEQTGITKGRTDTTHYTGGGSIIHFEVIASENMVERDVINLLQSDADIAISVIIDKEFDPNVGVLYYRQTTKRKFKSFLMSEILDPEKEEHTVIRLQEIINDLEIRRTDKEDALRSRLQIFLDEQTYPQKKDFMQILAIFPRSNLNLFENEHFEEGLFHKFESLGIVDAADPLALVTGWNWKLSHKGKFFNAFQASGEFYTALVLHSHNIPT